MSVGLLELHARNDKRPSVPLPSRPGLAPDGASDPHGRKYNGDVGALQAGRTEGQRDHVLRVGAPKMPRGYHAAPTVIVIVPHHGVPEEGSERPWGLFSCPACQSQPSGRPTGWRFRTRVAKGIISLTTTAMSLLAAL